MAPDRHDKRLKLCGDGKVCHGLRPRGKGGGPHRDRGHGSDIRHSRNSLLRAPGGSGGQNRPDKNRASHEATVSRLHAHTPLHPRPEVADPRLGSPRDLQPQPEHPGRLQERARLPRGEGQMDGCERAAEKTLHDTRPAARRYTLHKRLPTGTLPASHHRGCLREDTAADDDAQYTTRK